MPPPTHPPDETDVHALRLILRDLIYLLVTETKMDGQNRQTLLSHLDALDAMIGDDDYGDEESERS